MEQGRFLRQVISFARRAGKGFGKIAKVFYEENKELGLVKEQDLNADKLILEIGFGMGDNLLNLANQYQDHIVIGAEPYMDGVVRVLRNIADEGTKNVKFFPDDVNLLFNQYPNIKYDQIYLLFPDPWHKTRHLKRRIVQQEFLEKIFQKIKENGVFIIATDHADYCSWIEEHLNQFKKFQVEELNTPPSYYTPTKYHQKGTKQGFNIKFFVCKPLLNK